MGKLTGVKLAGPSFGAHNFIVSLSQHFFDCEYSPWVLVWLTVTTHKFSHIAHSFFLQNFQVNLFFILWLSHHTPPICSRDDDDDNHQCNGDEGDSDNDDDERWGRDIGEHEGQLPM